MQVFAPINFSRFHGVTDPVSKTQTFFRDVVEQWADLARDQGNRLSFYGYNWNLAESMMPYTKAQIWGEDLPYYYARGFRGLTLESTKQWSVLAPSDYVFMRMAWDTSQDWRDLLREYCEKAYGAGAEAMIRYWTRLAETQRAAGMEAGSYYAFPLIFDDASVAETEADIAEALSAAETDADRTRIFIGGVEDTARVWLNGEMIGQEGPAFGSALGSRRGSRTNSNQQARSDILI